MNTKCCKVTLMVRKTIFFSVLLVSAFSVTALPWVLADDAPATQAKEQKATQDANPASDQPTKEAPAAEAKPKDAASTTESKSNDQAAMKDGEKKEAEEKEKDKEGIKAEPDIETKAKNENNGKHNI